MLIIFRSLPLSADSRTIRNMEIYSKLDPNVEAFTWEGKTGNKNTFKLQKTGGKLSRAIKFILFVLWVPYTIIRKRKSISSICFMDLETAILGVPVAKLLKIISIFDIVDPFSQTKGSNLRAFDILEIKIAKLADRICVPDASRIQYYSDRQVGTLPNRVSVVENVPNFQTDRNRISILRNSYLSNRDEKKIRIGYFGTLDGNSRGLEYLVQEAEINSRLELIIGGGGELNEFFQKYSGPANLNFIGRFNHEELTRFLTSVDFNWAYYSPDIELHRYAAPNKFYEHLYFKLPIIVSAVIPQSKFIENNNTGLVLSDLQPGALFESCAKYLNHAKWEQDLWKAHYANYWDDIRAAI